MADLKRLVRDFPEAETTLESWLLGDGADTRTFKVKPDDALQQSVRRLPSTTTPLTIDDRILVHRETTDLVDRAPGTALLPTFPDATASQRGLMSQAQADKLQRIVVEAVLPVGGATGQALVKLDNTDYHVGWTTLAVSGGGSAGLDFANVGTGAALFKDIVDVADPGNDIARFRTLLSNTTALVIAVAGGAGDEVVMTIQPATTGQAGLLAAADKAKLDGIAAGADVSPPAYAGSAVGLVPASTAVPADTTLYLRQDGVWAAPPGTGSGGGGVPEAPSSPAATPVPYARVNDVVNPRWVEASIPGHTHDINTLQNVDFSAAAAGDYIIYTGTGVTAETIPPPDVEDLSNVNVVGAAEGDILVWHSASLQWVNGPSPAVLGDGVIAKAAALVGDAAGLVVTYHTGLVGKMVPVDLAAGDVTVEIPSTIAHAAGTVLSSVFVTEKGGTNRLRFQSSGAPVMPTLLQQNSWQRSSNAGGTALVAQPEGADRKTYTLPAGTDRLGVFILQARRLASPPNIAAVTMSLDGVTIPGWTMESATGRLYSEPDIWLYATPFGSSATDGSFILRVLGVDQLQSYVMMAMVFDLAKQASPHLEGGAFVRVNDPTSRNHAVSLTTQGPNRHVVYAASKFQQIDGDANPWTVTGANQIAAGHGGTNSSANIPWIYAEETVPTQGVAGCTLIAPPTLNDVIHLSFALLPATTAVMEIRTPGNVAANTQVNNKQVGLLYDGNNQIANVLL